MIKDIFDSVKEKEFSALTTEERAELAEICSSEFEFNQLKSVLKQVENIKVEAPQPKKETKAKLDDLFVQNHPKMAPVWYNSFAATILPKDKPLYRQPLVQIAAVALIAFFTVPFFNDSISNEAIQLAEVQKPENGSAGHSSKTKQTTESDQAENSSNENVINSSIEELETFEIVTEPVLVAAIPSVNPPARNEMPDAQAFASIPGSDHPDGVFMDGRVSFSQPASESPGIFDLLTTSF